MTWKVDLSVLKPQQTKLGLCYVIYKHLIRKSLIFFHDINRVLGDMEGQVILAGDFNQVMDGVIDKNKPSGKSFPRDRAAI